MYLIPKWLNKAYNASIGEIAFIFIMMVLVASAAMYIYPDLISEWEGGIIVAFVSSLLISLFIYQRRRKDLKSSIKACFGGTVQFLVFAEVSHVMGWRLLPKESEQYLYVDTLFVLSLSLLAIAIIKPSILDVVAKSKDEKTSKTACIDSEIGTTSKSTLPLGGHFYSPSRYAPDAFVFPQPKSLIYATAALLGLILFLLGSYGECNSEKEYDKHVLLFYGILKKTRGNQ
jgi:hypothetical protein